MTKKFLLSAVAAGTLAVAGVTAGTLNAPQVYAEKAYTVTAIPASGSTVKAMPDKFTIKFVGADMVSD